MIPDPLPSCAICGAEAYEYTEEPLGKNGVVVKVCAGCSTNKVESREVFRGYETAEDQLGSKHKAEGIGKESAVDQSWRVNISSAGNEFRRAGALQDSEETTSRRRPGAQLFRIAACDPNGRMRDFEQIIRIARRMPWYERSEYLFKDARWFCFQEIGEPE